MKKPFVISIVVIGVALASGFLLSSQKSSAESASTSSLTWNTFDKGVALAKEQHKKVLVDVYTDWCGWCKKMDSDVYTDSKVIKTLAAKFVLVKLNAESNSKHVQYQGKQFTEAQFAQAVGVSGYPSTLFFDSAGKPITLLPGFVPADKFVPILTYIGDDHYLKVSFEQYLSKSSPPAQ